MSRDERNSVVFTQIGNFTNATFLCQVTAIYGASSKLATILKLALTMASWLIEKTLTYYIIELLTPVLQLFSFLS